MNNTTNTPSAEVSRDLQRAYTHFNKALFGGTLPKHIMLTYQREGRSFGFFRHRRYLHLSRRETHELCLNPRWIAQRSLEESLATLVHAMCRLQQRLVGTRHSATSYHNRELAGRLKRVGLLPRVDGDPNGKETGHRVSPLVEKDGLFEVACRKLLAEGFAFSWVDRLADMLPSKVVPKEWRARPDVSPVPSSEAVENCASPPARLPEPVYARIQDKLDYRPRVAGLRRKYLCPGCGRLFWGGYGIKAKCVPCDRQFIDADPGTATVKRVRRKRLRVRSMVRAVQAKRSP